MMESQAIAALEVQVTRLGMVLEPNGDPQEIEGILNPAATRTRDGRLLLYPRLVAAGNVSRVGIVEVNDRRTNFRRVGYALEPQAAYEFRPPQNGYGCEDPRVTYLPALDAFVMSYTAFGPPGPRIALALSDDGFAWERLGLVDFSAVGLENEDDKDAAFFPEPVISPDGVLSLAFYHRPMMRLSATQDYQPLALAALALPPCERESIRIAYVPLAAVLEDRRELLAVAESVIVLEPQPEWGHLKTGAGTPPVAVAEGWLSVYHAVDHVPREGDRSARCYSAGLLLHDRERPHLVRYHSAAPIMAPETPDELRGTVNNVVFPTGIDCVPNGPDRCFEIYYGMADSRVGRARIELGASTLARESAA